MAKQVPYILGLDLGASSLGWAAITLDRANGKPIGIGAAGVRIFEAGVVGTLDDIQSGKDSSRAVQRREARQPRRQQWRRQQRKKKLFTLLQHLGLLPLSEDNQPATRKEVFDALDTQLAEKFIPKDNHDAQQKLPYILRQRACSEAVEPFELGRALYHLAQRRGYLSNRKGRGDNEREDGKVATGIGELQEKLNEHGDTLGEYFALRHDPFDERIRRRYTARNQYHCEFERIKQMQKVAHGQLDEVAWKKIYDAIFYQRPLKSQKHLIGRCDLEPVGKKWKDRRCPIALPIAQEFRILQKVNDLRVFTKDRYNDPLTDEECQKLIDALWTKTELKWGKIKTLLKLKGARFSLEEGDDRVVGHRTNAKMIAAFGERWLGLSIENQTAIVHEVLHFRKPQALINRARTVWGLDDEGAAKLAKTHLEDDHARHSKKALQKLVAGTDKQTGMRDGAAYATVRRALYPEQYQPGEERSDLPPISEWKRDIRNPAVIRALTEVRKVVNAIIEKYGKPAEIHIELARDIRNSRVKRKGIWKKNQENRTRREKAARDILEECGIDNVKRHQTDKWLLAEECNRECPYCGKSINMRSLMGDDAQFNIEHIFPRRYLDDSYMNKTIACRNCNDEKGDRTPKQAFSGKRYDEILARVEHFKGNARNVKLARFKMETPDDDPVARQLNDTRYNSRLAAKYLGLLYGGHSDAHGEQRILTPTGMLTSKVRGNWQLNDILGLPNQEKERQDHRHHAIDAVVVALMTQKQTQRMAELAGDAQKYHERHFFKSIPYPWPTFKDDVNAAIEAINVSHRPTRTIAGRLHAESIYSKNYGTEKQPEFRIRKELHKLKVKEIKGNQIVEPAVRKAVQQQYAALGGGQPAKVFTDRDNHPVLKTKDGREVPIHKVRIRVDAKPRAVGKDMRKRNIVSGKDSNYASMIYAVLDKEGNEKKWVHEIVTRMEAHERLSANHGKEGEKVLICDEQEGKRVFKFALRKNDMLLADGPDGERVLYRVQKISKTEIQLCEHTKGTIANNERTPWNRITSTEKLRQRNTQRVDVLPIGEIAEPCDK